MKIKIFTPNERGNIELSKVELERLLNEAYDQGWRDRVYPNFWYSSDTDYVYTTNKAINAVSDSVTTLEGNVASDKCYADSTTKTYEVKLNS